MKLTPSSIAIGEAALKSILLEVTATPKPGLVDRANSGAHQDMDFMTFMVSSASLSGWFFACAQFGLDHDGHPALLLPKIRRLGKNIEEKMFRATAGVNTQKGLLFLMGISCGAVGLLAKRRQKLSPRNIGRMIAQIGRGIMERELHGLAPHQARTSGEKLYLRYRVAGIRGEVARGLPAVLTMGLPCFLEALKKLSLNDAIVHSLIALMTKTEDTTIIARHGLETLSIIQALARNILDRGGMLTKRGRRAVDKLDRLFIKRNISPGGSADLVAMVIFFYLVCHNLELDSSSYMISRNVQSP